MSKVKLRTPNSLIFDIYGVITSHNFKEHLKNFAKENLAAYIDENYGNKRFVRLVNRLIQESDELVRLYPEAPRINENFPNVPEDGLAEIKKEIENNVRFRIEKKYYGNTILFFYEDIWFKGYKDGTLKAHVYDDVAKTLHFWRMHKFIKLYTLASGKSTGQQLFLANTLVGDLNPLIANCMDPSSFGKEDKKCFIAISLALRSDPEKLIYLTDSVKRMEVAKEVKFQVVLVKRPDNDVEYDPEIVKDTPVITSLSELEFADDTAQAKDCC